MFFIILFISYVSLSFGLDPHKIVYAINAGGEEHKDLNGVHYQADRLKVGTPSEHGKRYSIERVPSHDAILYQTERYHHSSFGYQIPLKEDGDYVLVLKFSEVYFQKNNQKVFDVAMNKELIVEDLDIYAKAGHGIAHDEITPFSIKNHKLYINDKEIDYDDRLDITFIKKQYDNPKINAFYIIKGSIEDIPKLPPITTAAPPIDFDEDMEDIYEQNREQQERPKAPTRKQNQPIIHASGPPQSDPYENDESSILLPIVIAIAAFIPVVFCLCKI